jgi:hypothetical protein
MDVCYYPYVDIKYMTINHASYGQVIFRKENCSISGELLLSSIKFKR